jgi:hypothetical protein
VRGDVVGVGHRLALRRERQAGALERAGERRQRPVGG